uniref:Putative secreted protein n=1 Tax=Ixodes ricinus TaxID=34613 RepID=V5H9G1_IXORI
MIWLLCLFTCVSVTRVAANCNVEQAIEGMKDCKHGLHTIEKKSFNASNPEHVKEACCSATGRLEACLHTAVTSAGCLHEVDYVVQDVDEASTDPSRGHLQGQLLVRLRDRDTSWTATSGRRHNTESSDVTIDFVQDEVARVPQGEHKCA